MCGRFVSTLPPDILAMTLSAMWGTSTNMEPNWNVAPTQAAPVVRIDPSIGQRRIDLLRWGLVPHFTKDLKEARKPINARSETVGSSGMFRGAQTARRCLVPADAFYEWKAMPDGKQPYAIARQDKAPLVFAGLWEGWRGPDDIVLRTFTILTTAANKSMQGLHERMPVVLEARDWAKWLGEQEGDPKALMRPAEEGVLEM